LEFYAEKPLLAFYAKNRTRRTFSLLGREWDLLPDVYSPTLTYATEFYTTKLPYPRGGQMLEVGCGAGVTSVQAILAGCREVTAVDINPAAVENTRLNTRRHGVAQRVRALRSNVFEALPEAEQFDLIFWNAPYQSTYQDNQDEPDNLGPYVLRSYLDTEYACCQAYLAGARDRLRPGGRLLLGSGDCGDRGELDRLFTRFGWQVRLLASARSQPDEQIKHALLELMPT
jgi:methylase of polypeptide subunit release factors